MISPNSFIEFECKDKSYKELLSIRDDLLESIYAYENGKISKEEWGIMPSPDVIYQTNLEYLAELCKLISETYNSEVVSVYEDDEEDENKESRQMILSVTTFPVRSPWNELKVELYDTEENNTIVKRSLLLDPVEPVFSFTMPDSIFKRIKNYMKDPVLRVEQEEDGYVTDSGIVVCDGEQTDVDLFFDDLAMHFNYSNLNYYKDYLDNYPQTKKVYKIRTLVLREARKQIRNRKAER